MQVRHGGPLFREFIADLLVKKSAKAYMEVGVRDGSTLQMIDCASIAIDPNFSISSFDFTDKTEVHFYQKTSDEFFRSHDPVAILGRQLDAVFLDGLHLFEFLLRDFANCERFCRKDSVIMLDDCLPINAEMVERYHDPAGRSDQSVAGWWTGDVWKMVPILKKARPDLHILAVDTAPTGTVCVTNLDPLSTVLHDDYFQLVREAQDMVFDMESFYHKTPVISASKILHGFDFSSYLGA